MGYRPERKIYRLSFEDHPGLEVRAKSVPLGEFLSISELAGVNGRDVTRQDTAKVAELFSGFAGALVDWNLEDDGGTPVPATLEGLYSQDFDFALEIIVGWMESIAGVPGPLDKPSSSGSPSLEASLPMEPLSVVQAS